MNLKGKTILVTGSSRRIGRVLALAVAKAGGDVIIHHNNSPDEAEITKQKISALGQEATILQADFSNPNSTDEFIKEVFSSQKLDGLVNNASVFSNLSWADTQVTQWNNHLAINLTTPFLLSQAFGLKGSIYANYLQNHTNATFGHFCRRRTCQRNYS